eukprot:TRINITY_DN108041_c0_g1_i1.p1 TRINITY_DN108041_c0_g1~~TRINITY_DN108041_c0_g1_i1.p1  ORF type:complete len:693 (+),score=129.13 TRINITY_DN108041_c0_g1_i1:53-2131(+)
MACWALLPGLLPGGSVVPQATLLQHSTVPHHLRRVVGSAFPQRHGASASSAAAAVALAAVATSRRQNADRSLSRQPRGQWAEDDEHSDRPPSRSRQPRGQWREEEYSDYSDMTPSPSRQARSQWRDVIPPSSRQPHGQRRREAEHSAMPPSSSRQPRGQRRHEAEDSDMPPPSSQESPRRTPEDRYQTSFSPRGAGPDITMTFGGLQVVGPAAKWLKIQEAMHGGKFVPSPIQDLAMSRIYDGESCCIHAPTGTGKTLCYLLPLIQRLEREATYGTRPGLRLLILVPTADLQMQTAALARALVGVGRSETVQMMRRGMDNEQPASIVVATPRQICELFDTPLTEDTWGKALGFLDMVVVDEADRLVNKWNVSQRKRRAREELVDPALRVLQRIEEETSKANRRDSWQLVAASATMNRRTHRTLKFGAGIDMTLIHASGEAHSQAHTGSKHSKGQYGDGKTFLPPGLRHSLRVVKPFYFPKVMAAVAETIESLDADRLLVVLATSNEKGRAPSSMFGLNLVVGNLRFRMEQTGRKYDVLTCSAAVEAAAELWSAEGSQDRVERYRGRREIVVANSEAVRGVHLDGIDAVVLVGEPTSVGQYLHAAGRTCRFQLGSNSPVGGTVVSVVSDNAALKISNWAELAGFKVTENKTGFGDSRTSTPQQSAAGQGYTIRVTKSSEEKPTVPSAPPPVWS